MTSTFDSDWRLFASQHAFFLVFFFWMVVVFFISATTQHETHLSPHLHTEGLVAFSLKQLSFPAPNIFRPSLLHCCCKTISSFSKLLNSLFLCLSPSCRTLEMMAHCTSPKWPRPTWATTPAMLMVTRNCFRPTLFKSMVRCQHIHTLNYLTLSSHLLHSDCDTCLTMVYTSISFLKTVLLEYNISVCLNPSDTMEQLGDLDCCQLKDRFALVVKTIVFLANWSS